MTPAKGKILFIPLCTQGIDLQKSQSEISSKCITHVLIHHILFLLNKGHINYCVPIAKV